MFASYKNRWWIVVSCTFGLTVVGGTINSFAFSVFLKPMSEELGTSRSVLSSGILVANVLCGLATPFVGLLADRWGSRLILLLGIPIFALCAAGFSLLNGSLTSLYATFALAGLAGAMQNTVPYTKVISHWFNHDRGSALGIALAGVGFGIAVVPQVAHFLIASAGWRTASIGMGGVIMLFAFLPVFLFVREPLRGERPHHNAPGANTAPAGFTAKEVFGGQWRFWAMALSSFLAVIATNGTLIHVVAMLTDRGMSTGHATAVLSSAGAGVILGRIGCGACLDRFNGPLVAVSFFIISAIGIACLATGLAGVVPFLGAALCGTGLGANNTIIAYFASRYFGMKAYGKIFGLLFGIFLIGAGIGPYLTAISYDLLHSYEPALVVSCLSLLGACLLLAPLGAYPFAAKRPTTAAARTTPDEMQLNPAALASRQ